jgi:hypothetical protein
MLLAALLALLGLTAIQPGARAEDQGTRTPAAIHAEAMMFIRLCQGMGGTPVVEVDRSGPSGENIRFISVACEGGLLGGLNCYFDSTGSFCFPGFVRPPEDPAVEPTGGIVVDEETAEPTPAVDDEVVVAEPIEEPVQDDVPVDDGDPAPSDEDGDPAPSDESVVDEHQVSDDVAEPGETAEDPGHEEPQSDGEAVVEEHPVADDVVVESGPVEEVPQDEP